MSHVDGVDGGSVDELARRFAAGLVGELRGDWQALPDVVEAHRRLAEAAERSVPEFPEGGTRPRGVVICGGGRKYFPCAWVCVRMLRHLGCELPIQLWHLGEREMDDPMRALIESLGVECVDGEALREAHPARLLNGWELKAYALVHAPFDEVLLLDADNVAVVEPTFLFETPEYREAGAVFWPDFGRLAPERSIWSVCGVEYRDEPEFESGQIVVDRRRCWAPLNLALHYNEHSDFYYHHVHGDKETFHLAFRRLGAPYAMPPTPIYALDGCMCQHDFEGNRVFQHRNMDKWRLDVPNRRIYGFLYEDLCRKFLEELRSLWPGSPHCNPAPNEREAGVAAELEGRRFRYRRVGHDERFLKLQPGGAIGEGADACERLWSVHEVDGRPALSIVGDACKTCTLRRGNDGVWRGHWLVHERMPIELTPAD